MARFLFVVPPLRGHINPTVAVGEELLARGHDVAWSAQADLAGPLLPASAKLLPAGEAVPPEVLDALISRSEGLRGAAALKFLWEDFLGPLARSMVPGVDAAATSFRPSVLVSDQQAVAGALVARTRQIPWATSASTSAELVDPLEGLPKVAEWIRSQLVAFQVEHGVSTADATSGDLRFSDQLVIAFTTKELLGPDADLPPQVALVGPAFNGRSRDIDVPFDLDCLNDGVPHVLVSLGTVSAGAGKRFFTTVVEALESAPVQVILVAPPELIERAPDNFIVRSFVPQASLLAHVDAVVCHAGHNTVCESLAHGLPLVVAPIRDDQPVVAQQVVNAGAGIRVRFGRVRAPELRDAVMSVLSEPSYRAAAHRVQRSFKAAGGAGAAANRLEELAASHEADESGAAVLR